jgi:hypothetical protein
VSSPATAGVFVLSAAAAFIVVAGWGPHRAGPRRSAESVAPLELVALENDRDADSFIVRGIVRNSAGAAVVGLTAAVSVFGSEGTLITTGYAAVAARSLPPGEETPFVVVVSNAAAVDRYHLSFRTTAGVLPHIDRRVGGMLARLS